MMHIVFINYTDYGYVLHTNRQWAYGNTDRFPVVEENKWRGTLFCRIFIIWK